MATLTTNKNFLSPVGFQFKINSSKYANLEYFCVKAAMPGLSLPAVDQSYRGVNLAFTGDRLQFEDLTLTVNVTENLENYKETFDWMHNMVNQGTAEGFKEDAILLILSSHNNVNKEIKFKDVFPTAITGVDFDSQSTDVEMVQIDITFAYTSFEFV
tara:strand:- start:12120 stop:12590 length:471 start_codon:yes stop_codon:yes gene_type:complete